jgi:hypothetical protein
VSLYVTLKGWGLLGQVGHTSYNPLRHERTGKGGPAKWPANQSVCPITYRTTLRASRPPATSRTPAPSAMSDEPPVGGSSTAGLAVGAAY